MHRTPLAAFGAGKERPRLKIEPKTQVPPFDIHLAVDNFPSAPETESHSKQGIRVHSSFTHTKRVQFSRFSVKKFSLWKLPPERLPRRAVRGLGAHSPHQTRPFRPLPAAKRPIFRGGRIHICTDDKNHAQVFLLGDDPKKAYQDNYSVIRHCLNMLLQNSKDGLQVDVYAYKNNYATSELMLNTEPHSFNQTVFSSNKKNLDLNACRRTINCAA